MAIYHVDIYNGKDRPTVTNAVASNPSGTTVLITYPNQKHDLSTGDQVVLTLFTAYLNGTWTITVVDDWSFTLDGVIWTTTADPTGTVTPVVGAPDGLSWATAWRKVYGHSTVLVSGDEIRVSKTPDPVSVGNADWTNLSAQIVLATARTQTIENCIGNTFTYSPNVTGSTWSYRKIGANCVRITMATAFTTGKIAYKTLPATLDLSGYQKISFWFQASNTTYSQNAKLRICLCSDALGDVIVNSFVIDNHPVQANKFYAVLLNNGSPLGSNINSISIYQDVDTPSFAIMINNIIATNDINHRSIIGKSAAVGTDYYPIQSIDGTMIKVDQNNESTTSRGYFGETETVETFVKDCYGIESYADQNNSAYTYRDATYNSPIIIKGGWDTVTNEENGETWFFGHNSANAGTTTSKYNHIYNFGFNSFNIGIQSVATTKVYNCQAINCLGGCYTTSRLITNCFFNNNSSYGLEYKGNYSTIYNVVVNNNGGGTSNAGIYLAGKKNRITKLSFNNNGYWGLVFANESSNRTSNNLNVGTGNVLKDLTAYSNQGSPIYDPAGYNTFIGPFNYDLITGNLPFGADTFLRNISMSTASSSTGYIKSFNHNGIPGAFMQGNILNERVRMEWQTDVKQSGATGSWKISSNNLNQVPNNEKLEVSPIYEIAQVAVEYNVPTTLRIWVKCVPISGSFFPIARLFIENDFSPIEADTYIDSINTAEWQELSIYFIPTYTGIAIMKIIVHGYDGNVYVGAISATT